MPLNTVSGTANSNNLAGTASADLITGFAQYGSTSSIQLTRVATGLTQPTFVTAPPDDTGRLFVIEKAGTIEILDLATNTRLATPFLDLTGTLKTNSEQGLLGLAFDPNYASNGTFYVFVSNLSGDSEIRRYKADPANPNVAATEFELVLRIDTPDNLSNHRAGWISFGPDGMLYAAVGDGGGGGDPSNNGQNKETLLGKTLRLDVSGADAFPDDATRNYAIPADNPFVGTAGADEIYAYGLRNPWRNSFDRGTGDLYIADVGQGVWEEVNLGSKGANYGWKLYEGPATYPGGVVGTPPAGITAPFFSYNHDNGDVSITGGYVYRGPQEGLFGSYIFGDYGSGRVWSLSDPDGDGTWTRTQLTFTVNGGGSIGNVASFGEDAEGRLYLVDFDGEVFRIDPVASAPDTGADTLAGGGGDDNMFGGGGADILTGDAGDDYLSGMAGADVLEGGDGKDRLIGGDDADTLRGGAEDDNLLGNAGTDDLDGGAGNDTMTGGAGNDRYVVANLGDMIMETTNTDSATDVAFVLVSGYTLSANVEIAYLGGTANLLTGADSAEQLVANGASTLFGRGGDDVLWGSGAADSLDGGVGDDIIRSQGGADSMVGGAGNDQYVVFNAGAIVLENADGGADTVWVDVDAYTLPENIELARLIASNATLTGTGNADVMVTAGANGRLVGRGGDDTLWGNAGADTLEGGAGDDILRGQGGADRFIGGAGNDQVVLFDSAATMVELVGEGIDTAWVAATSWVMSSNIEVGRLTGTGASLTGSADSEVLVANAGLASTVRGGGGNDTLWGSSFADTMEGGAGDDILYSVGGADQYLFSAAGFGFDQISGFDRAAGQKIVMTGLGTNYATVSASLTFGGGNTQINLGGDRVLVYGVTNLLESDFIF